MKQSLIICLILWLIAPINVEAKKKVFGNGFSCELSDDGVLVISGKGNMPETRPFPWYKDREKGRINKIIISEGITSIADGAFKNYVNFDGERTKSNTALKEVVLPASLEVICSSAFAGNLCLTKIKLGSKLKTIGSFAFESCGLYEIVIPNSVQEIDEYAFSQCRSLQKVVLSTGIQEIKPKTFIWCKNLKDISIPSNVQIIGETAFGFCGKLQEIIIPRGVKEIGKEAFFRYEYPIKKLSISSSTTSIGYHAFALLNRIGGAQIPYKCDILSLPYYINLDNCMQIGLSKESVDAYKKENTTDAKIKRIGGYTNVTVMPLGSLKYYKVNKGGRYGLTDPRGNLIIPVEMETIESAGEGYLRYKKNGLWGVTNCVEEIIPISRNYTFISNFDTNKRTFAFTKKGYTGKCDEQGREISTTKLPPTTDDIKAAGSYASAVELKDGSTKYWKVSKGGRYGLTDAEGKVIVPTEMEALESAGTGYLRYKLNGFWGLMNYTGKIIIDTNRGYTSIGDFKSFNKRFAYTMYGYKGECDAMGKQISKIKVETPKQNSFVASSPSSSSSNSKSSSNNNSGNKTTTVVVEHHRDPIPVQEWHACIGCGGTGKMGCDNCGGSGTKYIGDRLHRCSRCNGHGEIPCNVCYGNRGQYITVYK